MKVSINIGVEVKDQDIDDVIEEIREIFDYYFMGKVTYITGCGVG